MAIEIDALSYFASRNAEEHGAPAAVARAPEVVQCQSGLYNVLQFESGKESQERQACMPAAARKDRLHAALAATVKAESTLTNASG